MKKLFNKFFGKKVEPSIPTVLKWSDDKASLENLSDKGLDLILADKQVSRRQIYDIWILEKKDLAFPNHPLEVYEFAKTHGLL